MEERGGDAFSGSGGGGGGLGGEGDSVPVFPAPGGGSGGLRPFLDSAFGQIGGGNGGANGGAISAPGLNASGDFGGGSGAGSGSSFGLGGRAGSGLFGGGGGGGGGSGEAGLSGGGDAGNGGFGGGGGGGGVLNGAGALGGGGVNPDSFGGNGDASNASGGGGGLGGALFLRTGGTLSFASSVASSNTVVAGTGGLTAGGGGAGNGSAVGGSFYLMTGTTVDYTQGDMKSGGKMILGEYKISSLFVGVDHFFSKCFSMGLSGSYLKGESKGNGSVGKVEFDTYQATLYGTGMLCRKFFIDGFVSGTYSDYDSKKTSNREFSGSTDGWSLYGKLRFFSDLPLDCYFVRPSIGLYGGYFDINGYTEKDGAFPPLLFGDDDYYQLNLEPELMFYWNVSTKYGCFRPEFAVGLSYNLLRDDHDFFLMFEDFQDLGQNIRVDKINGTQSFARAGLNYETCCGTLFNLNYENQFGGKHNRAWSWHLSVSKRF